MIKYDKMEINVCVQVDALHPMWGGGGDWKSGDK